MILKPEMSRFVYDIPTKVYFGPDQLGNLGPELAKYGKKVLMTYGGGSIKKNGLYDRAVEEIKQAGLELFELSGIDPNPRVSSVNAGADICKKEGIDVILAVGGGSTIDCSKLIGAAAFYDGDGWDLITGKGEITDCIPIVSILTIAATGAEMDCFAVISNDVTEDKLEASHPSMLPKVTFMDPTVTYSVGKFQTACGSADIMSHILETYFVPDGNSMYMLDRFMEGMMKTVIRYAPVAMEHPDDYEARANLMWTSSWAINGLVAGLQKVSWSCHSIEHELSAYYDITHGLGLAIVTPRWMRHVLDHTTVDRFVEYGVNVFGIDSELPKIEIAEKSIELTEDFFFNKLGLSSTLTEIGIGDEKIPLMAEKACHGMDALPGYKALTPADFEAILRECL